jgi:hypothetical protein
VASQKVTVWSLPSTVSVRRLLTTCTVQRRSVLAKCVNGWRRLPFWPLE